MSESFTFETRFRASHFNQCGNSPQPYRHDHNFTVKVVARHEGGLKNLTDLTGKLTAFDSHLQERYNGRDLNAQVPTGMAPTATALAYYLFTWLDLYLADQLTSVEVSDSSSQPVVATNAVRASLRAAAHTEPMPRLLTAGDDEGAPF